MDEQIDIIAMTVDDYEDVVTLWQATDGLGEVETPVEFHAFLSRNPSISSIARSGGQLVGAVLGGHDGKRAFLYHLAVAAEYRGQHIAEALIDRCLGELRRQSIPRCSVHVYVANSAACEFWLHQSWRERVDLKVFAIDLPQLGN